jgi:LysR family transcriptional regulator, regulator for genes of the gallate degradation pathway
MTPNIRHLLAFTEVARHGSVSAAARAIHLSQPAVSQEIARVERLLGGRLFVRAPTGLRLTAAGEAAFARVERAIGHLQDGLAQLTRAAMIPYTPALLRRLSGVQLEMLVGVVECGSFAGAARGSGRSRTTVHKGVRQLERTLRASLFETTSFGLRPTREAERLAVRIRLAFAEVRQAQSEVSTAEGAERGATVIGTMPLARSILVPTAILDFARLHPGHAVSILDGPYDNLLTALRSGSADMLVGALRDPLPAEDVIQEHLFDDPLAIIVRARHPLTGRRRIEVGDLTRYAWVAPRRASPLRQHYERLVQAVGEAPREVAIECNSLVAARALLAASDRVMLLSAHQIHHELATGELIALPHPLGPVMRPIGLTLRSGWQPTPVQEQLLEAIRRHARRLAQATQRHVRRHGMDG